MERYRTVRAYSAGGVVFRLVPPTSSEQNSNRANRQDAKQQGIPRKIPVTKDAAGVEVALVGRSQAGIWVLPKGTPRSGETIEQVAVREVEEETGLKVRLISYIGSISYTFVRDHIRYQKQVRHFLFEAIGGDIALHDHEYDQVQWFPLSEAYRRLTYANEVQILGQAAEVLQRWLDQRCREEQK